MKKIFKSFAVLLVLFFLCKVPARATNTEWVRDEYGLLSYSEVLALNEQAERIAEAHDFGVYVRVLDSWYGNSIEEYAERVFQDEELGVGDEQGGILLIVTMSDRSYDILVKHTTKGDASFTQYAREQMASTIVDYMRSGSFYSAFQNYISICDTDLSYYETGTPLSPSFDPIREEQEAREQEAAEAASRAAKTGATLGIPPITALLACLGMRSKNKTTGLKTEASDYIAKNGINMMVSQDLFLYRSESRTRIHRDNDSGGGGNFHSSSSSFGGHTSGHF